MLEYPIEEAMSLLSKNLENAKKNLKQVELDLDFIKEQTTTTEVNLARIYNWDVRKRQSASPEDSANAAAEQSNEWGKSAQRWCHQIASTPPLILRFLFNPQSRVVNWSFYNNSNGSFNLFENMRKYDLNVRVKLRWPLFDNKKVY